MLLINTTVSEIVDWIKHDGVNCVTAIPIVSDDKLREYITDVIQLERSGTIPYIHMVPGSEEQVQIEFQTDQENPPTWGDEFLQRIREYICKTYSQVTYTPGITKETDGSALNPYLWYIILTVGVSAFGLYYLLRDR